MSSKITLHLNMKLITKTKISSLYIRIIPLISNGNKANKVASSEPCHPKYAMPSSGPCQVKSYMISSSPSLRNSRTLSLLVLSTLNYVRDPMHNSQGTAKE